MKKQIIDKLSEIGRKFDIVFLGVFGSFTRKDFTNKSDIDLLVRFSKRKSLLDMVRIERELSEILNIKVDLLTEKSISPYLKERINRELRVIYDDEG